MGQIHFFNNLIVVALGHHESSVKYAFVQQILDYVCLKRPENVSRSEMDPEGGLLRGLFHLFPVISRKSKACLLPYAPVFQP